KTAEAAEIILREGGNAFDAILAAHFCACVAEPVLASLGGGGFLLAHNASGSSKVYDFFAHTALKPLPKDELDFHPIEANFGTAVQEFHIGLGSIATPGAVKGVFRIHKDLCSMPISEIAQPAIEAARNGIRINAFQAYIFDIVNPIYHASAAALRQYQSHIKLDSLVTEDEWHKQPKLADTIEILTKEGEALFYRGEIANQITSMCHKGGQITAEDLAAYDVVVREPLQVKYHNHLVLTNPPPSCGGALIAFALKLLQTLEIKQYAFASADYLNLLTRVMQYTNAARIDAQLAGVNKDTMLSFMDTTLLEQYREKILHNARSLRGTTHMNVMDNKGNIASLTVSNGEGCGHLIADTGIMLNNMLGEEDLNPKGFFQWPANQRMTSMMAPSLVIDQKGYCLSLGSGGSNRLRTAILQVLLNTLDFNMPLQQAIQNPRIHFENDLLSVEYGFDETDLHELFNNFPKHKYWQEKNLFFGGVHAVDNKQGKFSGCGDVRRGGVAKVVY
ncbi:gamma-glutamyltransferase, partial [Kaarinaea lacus]